MGAWGLHVRVFPGVWDPGLHPTVRCGETLATACIDLLFFAFIEFIDVPAENSFRVEGHFEGSRPESRAPVSYRQPVPLAQHCMS